MKINDLFNTTWKKCIIVFIAVFILVVVCGFFSISYLDNVVTSNNFHSDYIIVRDKFTGNNTNEDYYFIMDVNNQTYVINNNNAAYDKQLFDSMNIDKRYRVVFKNPVPTDANQMIYIVQVHNDTS